MSKEHLVCGEPKARLEGWVWGEKWSLGWKLGVGSVLYMGLGRGKPLPSTHTISHILIRLFLIDRKF